MVICRGIYFSDGADIFEYTLFKVEDDVTTLLDSKTPDTKYLDGIVRASVAYGENHGAKYFSFNLKHEPLKKYKQVFFGEYPNKIETSVIFSGCKHD